MRSDEEIEFMKDLIEWFSEIGGIENKKFPRDILWYILDWCREDIGNEDIIKELESVAISGEVIEEEEKVEV